MTPTVANNPDARTAVLDGLGRLRTLFPLEERLRSAGGNVRQAYAELLRHWLRATPPAPETIADALRAALLRLDAIVHETHGLGCYPFSARDTGIAVVLPTGKVSAMCAIDALAVARVARAHTQIHASCETCNTSVSCRVQENGSLDHDQAGSAQVFWQAACGTHGSCSQGLCRNIRFLCPDCAPPSAGEVFTLPQATAIGNAFFGFQHALLHGRWDV
jgi:hypothetical protein